MVADADVVEHESKKRIVIVDDNDDMLSFLHSLLSSTYDVKAYSDAKAALDAMQDMCPDLVISDVMMPEMDGMEFCRIMKTDIRTSHIPVILLTAKVENNDVIDGFDSGADMYITKPFSPQVIEARIRSVLVNRAILAARLQENPAAIETVLPEESPDKQLFKRLNEIIVLHIGNPRLSVDFIADEMAVGRTTLYDKMRKLTGMTPKGYIRKMRMCRAAEMLRQKESNVTNVSENVGFQSRSYFIKCFFEHYGMLPGEYKDLHSGRPGPVA